MTLRNWLTTLIMVPLLSAATSKTWPGGATNQTPTAYSIPASGELNWSSLSSFLNALGDSAQSTTLQKFAVRRATTTPVTVSATTDCVIVTALASPGAVAVTLPTAATKQVFTVVDGTGDAATNAITITPASGNINGSATYVINKNNGGVVFIADGTQWTVISEFTAASSSSTTTALTKTNTVTGITNKSLSDSTTTIEDNVDTTKKLAFQVSGVTTGTTRTLTVPDASTTVVGTDTTQTLTNKTMGSTNTLTGATAGSFTNSGTITLPTSSDTLVARATTDTLSNKTLDNTTTAAIKDTLFTLQDDGDATKLLAFQLSGITTSSTATITMPSGSGTMCLLTATQTLTNKTLGNTNTASLRTDKFTVQDASDTTKQLILGLSGITTTTTRTMTVPDADFTAVGTATSQTLTNKTLTSPVISSISNTGTLTLPTSSDTLVGRATTDTLTNKTLTAPVIATIVNSGTLTLPTSSDTMVGRATTDTLTNKTLTSPALSSPTITTSAQYSAQAEARYADSDSSNYVGFKSPATVTVNKIWTLPSVDGSANASLVTDGSGTLSFTTPAGAQDSSKDSKNYTLTGAVGSSALTIALKNKAGSDPSSGDPVNISFRSTTSATGDYTVVSATAATSLVVNSTATLGLNGGSVTGYTYVYAINNAGTIELGISAKLFDCGSTISSTTVAGGSNTATTMYSTTGRATKACRILGRLKHTLATAGTWDEVPDEIALEFTNVPYSEVRCSVANYGSSGTKTMRYTNATTTGVGITRTASTSNNNRGDKFVINEAGVYAVSVTHSTNTESQICLTLNDTDSDAAQTAACSSKAVALMPAQDRTSAASGYGNLSWTGILALGDTIRAMSEDTAGNSLETFNIVQVARF